MIRFACPSCNTPVSAPKECAGRTTKCRTCGKPITVPQGAAPPQRIGRYRIERLLDRGGFGLVYLAHDDQLRRPVAIKVPHAHLVANAGEAEAYLTEARTVASLDHPNIVPVFDVGGTDQFPCFFVSKYIDGSNLRAKTESSRLSLEESVEIVAIVADALHYAHRQGIVHRDIKPSNLILDRSGKPFVTDFGLALREQDATKGSRYAGTPAYMSPEQARGEGHRVDGRSDIFSLGVVLYELLSGQRPFRADSQKDLLEQITGQEARPARQIDDRIPKELDRVCLKALSKRASERYATAKDMADDLRHWLRPLQGAHDPAEAGRGAADVSELELAAAPALVKDVFLSYASPDKEAAFQLCRLLEEQGIGCWIAPRDVPPGSDYGEAIIRAIEAAKATFVLLSTNANASVHVTHEVERATSKRKCVIPVRIEDVLPSPSLELHLATSQWVDAWSLSSAQVVTTLALVVRGDSSQPTKHSRSTDTSSISTTLDQRTLQIVPKGLRSFDAHDASFFLELLPAPRDRDGLPESIRSWKTRIETTDPDGTFSVGLIYGPSGCGKSSLVRAGLLPRLAKSVLAVYVEATDEETEVRLLKRLQRLVPDLPPEMELAECLTALRRGRFLESGQKVLLVLDQFEQWLQATHGQENTELVQALRQCDGSRVQCIVMVRDDFWMAATRFMRELEIPLVEGQNSAVVDLFPVRHAEKVLAAFGRAFGTLPDKAGDLSKDQKKFIEECAHGLAIEGKVICVRLALFAEMMKGKPWTPASLKEVGGTSGVGLTFLEETFSAESASAEHRYHQKGARAVLKALLPDADTKIKGHMRSYAELLEESGYADRPLEFATLIRILDGEIRLITPTDPEGIVEENESPTQTKIGPKYYQLAHDYLVHSLRDWLTRKQKETASGRAELLLADRASIWTTRRENRQLPSLFQWISIRLLTKKKNWTDPQRSMMAQATRHHAKRGALLAVVFVILAVIGARIRHEVLEHQKATRAAGLVQRLLDANIAQVPGIVKEIEPYRYWADPLLRAEHEKAADGSPQKLRTSLALLPVDPEQVDYLYGQALVQPNREATPVIRDCLLPHRDRLEDRLWAVLEQPERGSEGQRLRAASLLAQYDSDSPRWNQCGGTVVEELVSENPIHLGLWIQAFQPVKAHLLRPLSDVFHDTKQRDSERNLATNILAEYAGDQPEVLIDLLLDADDKQFAVLFPKLKDYRDGGLTLLTAQLGKRLAAGAKEEDKEKLAKRQASAAVTLLRSGQTDIVWPLLKAGPDPRVRSYIVHRLNLLGADPRIIVKHLDEEQEVSIDQALLLSLGNFQVEALSASEREAVRRNLLDMYQKHPDPGIHAAAEWVLRRWKLEDSLKETDKRLAKDNEGRQERIQQILQELAKGAGDKKPQWYMNSQGQTLVVLPGPMEFMMGAPPAEVGRNKEEVLHRQRIGRTFAIASKPVTVEQFRRYSKDYSYRAEYAPTTDCPVHSTTWYMAVAYCNWLSEQEGLPPEEWCYLPNKDGKYEEGMKPAPDYLKRSGYRLPTEAECEYACRAGTITSRYYGESEDLLDEYGWSMNNSNERTWPVGSLKPNDWGLFDMHGNVYTWCHEREKTFVANPNGVATDDDEDTLEVTDKDPRELRGSSFGNRAINLRSPRRYRFAPTFRASGIGFRVVRTIK